MGKVSLVRTDRGVKEAVGQALDLIGGIERFVRRGDKVLLKPNLNGAEGCTGKEVTGSVIELLSDFGAGRIFLAEATFGTPEMTDAMFRETGYAELAKRYGIDLFNLNASEPVEIAVNDPLVLESLKIAREYFQADRVINLPNMKVHYATGVSLALKNLKGLLVGNAKRRCHEAGLDRAIVDLNRTIRPHLNVVDAVSCMERMGPRGGDVVRMDLVLAGEHPAEVDCIGAAVMGFCIDEIRHLREYIDAERMDPAGIETVGERIADVRYPFRKAVTEGVVPEKFTVFERDACSACMNALLLSCGHLEGEPDCTADIHLGSKIREGDAKGDLSIAFGNCCPKDRTFDVRIPGCPPYSRALNECLERRRRT